MLQPGKSKTQNYYAKFIYKVMSFNVFVEGKKQFSLCYNATGLLLLQTYEEERTMRSRTCAAPV
jgi:hypothetical protein